MAIYLQMSANFCPNQILPTKNCPSEKLLVKIRPSQNLSKFCDLLVGFSHITVEKTPTSFVRISLLNVSVRQEEIEFLQIPEKYLVKTKGTYQKRYHIFQHKMRGGQGQSVDKNENLQYKM